MNAINPFQFSRPLDTLTSVTGTAATDLLTKTDHGFTTGDPFVITFSSGFAGLTTTTKYWAIVISSNTWKAATSLANAVAGTPIDITSNGTGATVIKATAVVPSAGVALSATRVLFPGETVRTYLITPDDANTGNVTVGCINSSSRPDPRSPCTAGGELAPFNGYDLSTHYFLGTNAADVINVFGYLGS